MLKEREFVRLTTKRTLKMRKILLVTCEAVLALILGPSARSEVVVLNPTPPNTNCIGNEIHYRNNGAAPATVVYVATRNSDPGTTLTLTLQSGEDRFIGCYQSHNGLRIDAYTFTIQKVLTSLN